MDGGSVCELYELKYECVYVQFTSSTSTSVNSTVGVFLKKRNKQIFDFIMYSKKNTASTTYHFPYSHLSLSFLRPPPSTFLPTVAVKNRRNWNCLWYLYRSVKTIVIGLFYQRQKIVTHYFA